MQKFTEVTIEPYLISWEGDDEFNLPPDWPVWILRDAEGTIIKTQGGMKLSCPTRKLAEIIRYELFFPQSDSEENIGYYKLQSLNIDGGSDEGHRFTTKPSGLEKLILDGLFADEALSLFTQGKHSADWGFHLNKFMTKRQCPKIGQASMESNARIYADDSARYVPGEFGGREFARLTELEKKTFTTFFQSVLDEVSTLGNPDLNLLYITGINCPSILHRLFWVQGKISGEELELIERILDGKRVLTIESSEKFKTFTSYLHSSFESSQRLIEHLPPAILEMPSEAILALKAGIRILTSDYQPDFSPAVTSICKSIEIILKTQIFDEYRKSRGQFFTQETNVLAIQNDNSKAIRLANFIEKSPHHLELGGMETIFKWHGGKTEKKEPLVRDFFEFIRAETDFGGALKPRFIELLGEFRKVRNRKVHSEHTADKGELISVFLMARELLWLIFSKETKMRSQSFDDWWNEFLERE